MPHPTPELQRYISTSPAYNVASFTSYGRSCGWFCATCWPCNDVDVSEALINESGSEGLLPSHPRTPIWIQTLHFMQPTKGIIIRTAIPYMNCSSKSH